MSKVPNPGTTAASDLSEKAADKKPSPELDLLISKLADSGQSRIVKIYESILGNPHIFRTANAEHIFLALVNIRDFLLSLTTGDLFAIEQLVPKVYPTVLDAIADLDSEDPTQLPANTLEILRIIHCRQRHIASKYDDHLEQLNRERERISRLEADLKKAARVTEQVRIQSESRSAYYDRLNRHVHEVLESVSPEVHNAVLRRLGELDDDPENPEPPEEPLPGSDLYASLRLETIAEWTTHTKHFLARANIEYLYQLLEQTPEQLLSHYGIGKGTVDQITAFLSAHGLTLATTPKK